MKKKPRWQTFYFDSNLAWGFVHRYIDDWTDAVGVNSGGHVLSGRDGVHCEVRA